MAAAVIRGNGRDLAEVVVDLAAMAAVVGAAAVIGDTISGTCPK